MRLHSSDRGFTLIELLVVIAIIGVLSSVVLASLNTARAKARDAKRKSDLHQIQLALELYYDSARAYPARSSTIVESDLTALVPTYLSTMPKDPIYTSSSGYRYTVVPGGGYTLLAYLENPAGWCRVSTGLDVDGWNPYYPPC